MVKTEKNKEKDRIKREGKIWIDEHISNNQRKCSSGMVFGGKYINEK